MKNTLKKVIIVGAVCAVIAAAAIAALPTFLSKAATGSTVARAIFPQDPTSQIRVVSAISSSDLSSSTLKFYSGGTATYTVATNATSSTNLYVASTNGFALNNVVYVQGTGSNVVATVTSLVSSTNVGLSAAIGANVGLNCEVEILGSALPTLAVGATTNKTFASDGLVVGNYGRALVVEQTGTGYSSLDSVTVHYDSAAY